MQANGSEMHCETQPASMRRCREALRARLEAAEKMVEAARAAAGAPENSDALYDAFDDALADYDAKLQR